MHKLADPIWEFEINENGIHKKYNKMTRKSRSTNQVVKMISRQVPESDATDGMDGWPHAVGGRRPFRLFTQALAGLSLLRERSRGGKWAGWVINGLGV